MTKHKFYVEIETEQTLEVTGNILCDKIMRAKGWGNFYVKTVGKRGIESDLITENQKLRDRLRELLGGHNETIDPDSWRL